MKIQSRLQTLTRWLNAYLIVFLLAGLAVGFVLDAFFSSLETLISPILVVNMFTLALGCTIAEFALVLRSPGKVIATVLFIYLIIPVTALGIGYAFFPHAPELTAGLVLITVLPVAVTSAVWTDLSDGNLPFTLSIITLTTLLAGIITPTAMTLVAGTLIEFDAISLVLDLVKTVILPVIVGLVVRQLLPRFAQTIKPVLDILVKINIVITLAINSAVMKPYLGGIGAKVLWIIGAVFLLILFSYLLGYIFGGIVFRRDRETRISTAYVCGMRNNGAGLVIASAYFPPLVALPVIMSILLQQPLANVIRAITVSRTQKIHEAEYANT